MTFVFEYYLSLFSVYIVVYSAILHTYLCVTDNDKVFLISLREQQLSGFVSERWTL